MSVHSKKRARTFVSGATEIGIIQILALSALLAGLLALWPASQASASVAPAYAGEMFRDAGGLRAVAPEARNLAGFSIHRTLRAFRPAPVATAAARPAHRLHARVRLVLTPRRLAASTVSGQLAIDLSEDVALARDVNVRTSWAKAVEPTAQDNPFTLVGNRGGLVNANQTEVRDGEIWLTAETQVRETTRPGVNTMAAP